MFTKWINSPYKSSLIPTHFYSHCPYRGVFWIGLESHPLQFIMKTTSHILSKTIISSYQFQSLKKKKTYIVHTHTHKHNRNPPMVSHSWCQESWAGWSSLVTDLGRISKVVHKNSAGRAALCSALLRALISEISISTVFAHMHTHVQTYTKARRFWSELAPLYHSQARSLRGRVRALQGMINVSFRC